MNFFKHGNKAVLIIGILLMIADSFFAMAHEFGAWLVGCLFCIGYSATAIREDERINKNLKRWLYAYLAIVFVFAVLLDDFFGSRPSNAYRPILSSQQAAGIEARPVSIALIL